MEWIGECVLDGLRLEGKSDVPRYGRSQDLADVELLERGEAEPLAELWAGVGVPSKTRHDSLVRGAALQLAAAIMGADGGDLQFPRRSAG